MVNSVMNEHPPASELPEEPPPLPESFPGPTADELVGLFAILADKTRLQILYYLTQVAELNVGNLCNLLGQSQPAVSHHLALMRRKQLIDMRRDGKHNFYRLMPDRVVTYRRTLEEFLSFARQRPEWSRVFEGFPPSTSTS
ncbi:MAG: ArsR/SmtB family transcription factor [Planctomycetota bacterium]